MQVKMSNLFAVNVEMCDSAQIDLFELPTARLAVMAQTSFHD